MDLEPGIRRLRFRRWYERQLFESFAWLATCLLSGIVFAAIIEFVGFAGGAITTIATLLVLYVVGLIGLAAWRTFWRSLTRAQDYAARATCPACAAYGLFNLIDEPEPTITVCCRNCGHHWRLDHSEPSP